MRIFRPTNDGPKERVISERAAGSVSRTYSACREENSNYYLNGCLQAQLSRATKAISARLLCALAPPVRSGKVAQINRFTLNVFTSVHKEATNFGLTD